MPAQPSQSDALWRANSAQSAARQQAFSKIMAAHARVDQGYADTLRERASAAAALNRGQER